MGYCTVRWHFKFYSMLVIHHITILYGNIIVIPAINSVIGTGHCSIYYCAIAIQYYVRGVDYDNSFCARIWNIVDSWAKSSVCVDIQIIFWSYIFHAGISTPSRSSIVPVIGKIAGILIARIAGFISNVIPWIIAECVVIYRIASWISTEEETY